MNFSHLVYLFLTALFSVCLVTGNIIFQKFFFFSFFSLYTFEISVGLIVFPLTFVITDVISEIFGYQWAKRTIWVGLLNSLFIMGIIYIADLVPATAWSPVSHQLFHKVFGLYDVAIISSLIATSVSQFLDAYLFSFIRRVTRERHLWLRNNLSTIIAQFVDTFIVLFLLMGSGVLTYETFKIVFWNSFLFKILMALADTPFVYLGVFFLKKIRRSESL